MIRWPRWRRSRHLVALLWLSGAINESNRDRLSRQLAAVRQSGVKGLVLRINSPGGTVGASQELFESVKRLRLEHGVKVVASLADVAASGALYVAVAADRIVANAGVVTGSIGVLLQNTSIGELLRRLGVSPQVIKAGEYKDLLSYTRPPTEAERTLLQGVVDDTHAQFIEAVASGRNLSLEQVRQFADGRIFTGRQALAYGLVDELGGLRLAVERCREICGLPPQPPLVLEFRERRPLWQRLFQSSHLSELWDEPTLPQWRLPRF
ncbi:MAG: signal peptide peptidase SppA [Deinococcus sp.]|nr:signal peptide peptidase SppA [Deinococcus sp.]